MIHQITRAELIVIAARLKQAQDMVGYSNERMATIAVFMGVAFKKLFLIFDTVALTYKFIISA